MLVNRTWTARWDLWCRPLLLVGDRGLELVSALGNNPVEFTKADAVRVLRQLI